MPQPNLYGDAMVLRPMKFLGEARLPGDVIPAAELAVVSETVMRANYEMEYLGDPAKFSDTVLDEARVRQILREEVQEMSAGLATEIIGAVKQAIADGEVTVKPPATPRGPGRPRKTPKPKAE